jgi:hypothetical protein
MGTPTRPPGPRERSSGGQGVGQMQSLLVGRPPPACEDSMRSGVVKDAGQAGRLPDARDRVLADAPLKPWTSQQKLSKLALESRGEQGQQPGGRISRRAPSNSVQPPVASAPRPPEL